MRKLTREDLLGLEQYAAARARLRAEVIEHKRRRCVAVGPHMTWSFEDRATIRHQVQEMLRAERIFEPAAIQEELDAYNPLVPDGGNWKATLLIEYTDAAERQAALARLRGVEERCWVRIGELPPVFAVADEDLERENEEKTSAVHFLRFELTPPLIAALRDGAALRLGVDHEHYRHECGPLAAPVAAALCADLD